MIDVLAGADLAMDVIARPGQPAADLKGDDTEALWVGPAAHRQVVCARVQLDRWDGDRIDAAIGRVADELGDAIEWDRAVKEVDREGAELVLIADDLRLKDEVVLYRDLSGRYGGSKSRTTDTARTRRAQSARLEASDRRWPPGRGRADVGAQCTGR